ncbi:RNA polymerase sigma factor FliA [Hydrogenimonas thermophila]|uniref:RNA polymerase, sigma 28 subunit, SigD/FliA/WhiG n=1 Tax=Hydrogenimonas thermophila TaxID=223786 RepID=A0A1I5LW18_9BACT|nr:RNA polymerase sigma factor FliA [Hydrogenimonas thermophila]WOE70442.1 RNA polymerase sigma factor FliA [Hydrogenimonas thermophila]WOE72959.1 RNA polymerase sigma factor FliA [Hydrogenimonas thermophila]SFP00966.1 RNA polymerase, sigma 28 subunit, SigD/FliA/WhiG [Hydrogenimonas thermophila]
MVKRGYDTELRYYQDELAVQYLPAVKAMVFRLKERLPQSVEFDDLVSIGAEELIKLARRYDKEQNDSFWGYAKTRVYGAMLDYLRSLDIVSRANRKLIKQIDEIVEQYLDENGVEPENNYIAEVLGEDIEKIKEARRAAAIYNVLPLHDQLESQERDTFALVEQEELIEKIMDVLATMPKRDQLIMQLYYFEELTYKEISEVLDITPSRISQVHKRVVSKIKQSIG